MNDLSPKELLGELRAAVHNASWAEHFKPETDTAHNPSNMGVIGYCLARTAPQHGPQALALLTPLFHVKRGGAELYDWFTFILRAHPALTQRIAREVPWLSHPEIATAQWFAAWLWQCTINEHPRGSREEIARDGLHVCLGLGGHTTQDDPPVAYLGMEWDDHHMRHVTLHVPGGGLRLGEYNDSAALRGFGGVPEHFPRIETM